MIRRVGAVTVTALLALLAIAATASAHARVSPAVSLSGELQLYSLAVPTERSGVTTSRIVLTVPKNFSIDSFAPNPGWHRVLQQTGAGDNAVVQKVTWSGGHVPSGEDSLFQFLAQPGSPGTYTFQVQQTYSDGSIVDWNGSESSEAPAPTIKAVSSLGGGGSGGAVNALEIVAVVLAALALAASVLALVSRGDGGRPLA